MKRIIPVLALSLSFASLFAQSDPAALKGKPFPAFKATTFAGKPVSNAALKGKVVLIDFWATWCGPCKASMPMIERLHKRLAKSGVVVTGASIGEPGAASRKYVVKNGFTYNFIGDQDPLATKLGVQGIPMLFVIDKKGVVQLVKTGFNASAEKQEESELAALLTRLNR